MIDWYFVKLGPVIGIALAGAVGIVVVAGLLSVVVGVLDRDKFQLTGKIRAEGEEKSDSAER